MMRKMVFSLFFLVFMIILATCSMVKEEGQSIAHSEPASTSLVVQYQ